MSVDLTTSETDALPPVMAWQYAALMFLAVAAGALAAVVVLPAWLPGLSASLLGREPKAYWYLSRATAFVAFVLLWLSTALGLTITNRLARLWPGGPTAADLHQHTGLLGLAFALFHALILLGDRYISFTVAQLSIPFAATAYRPLWTGLGQTGFYLMVVVGLSFYARRAIGHRRWRLIHYAGFAVFLLALLHGVFGGTDSATPWARTIYWASGGSVLFLTIFRLFTTGRSSAAGRQPLQRRGPSPDGVQVRPRGHRNEVASTAAVGATETRHGPVGTG